MRKRSSSEALSLCLEIRKAGPVEGSWGSKEKTPPGARVKKGKTYGLKRRTGRPSVGDY
jgi:hypothetical protein